MREQCQRVPHASAAPPAPVDGVGAAPVGRCGGSAPERDPHRVRPRPAASPVAADARPAPPNANVPLAAVEAERQFRAQPDGSPSAALAPVASPGGRRGEESHQLPPLFAVPRRASAGGHEHAARRDQPPEDLRAYSQHVS
jgi:hypothetical protein